MAASAIVRPVGAVSAEPQRASSQQQRFWTAVVYTPSVALPLVARVVVLSHGDLVVDGVGHFVKIAVLGALQDLAILLQGLVAAHSVLALRHRARKCQFQPLMAAIAAVALALVFLWMTLACFVDLALVLSYVPRLNGAFVRMYIDFAGQFASSMQEQLSFGMQLSVLVYVVTMGLWVMAVLSRRVVLPRFAKLFCDEPRPKGSKQKSKRSLWASPTPRTCCVAALASFAALHATLALDGNAIDIYAFSNAMFSLETEDLVAAALQAPTEASAPTLLSLELVERSEAIAAVNSSVAITSSRSASGSGSSSAADNHVTSLSSDTVPVTSVSPDAVVAAAPKTETFADTEPVPTLLLIDRLLGSNEAFAFATEPHSHDRRAFPLWRKTLGFTGEKRFELQIDKTKPPTILLIHVESMRSLEVGVIGGRDKKAQFNQTVTPVFDALSETGVLFRQHYTPSIQTSRTLLSTLFGIFPSMTIATAVSTFAKTQLRLHGLPKILRTALNYTSAFWSAVDLGWEDWRGFLTSSGFDMLVGDHDIAQYLPGHRVVSRTDTFSWGVHDAVSLEALASFLESRTDPQPLFLDVYTVSSHDPFMRLPGFGATSDYSAFVTRENRGYVDTIHYADRQLGKLLNKLRAKDLLNNTIVLIQGDHGYGRNERGNNPGAMTSRVFDEVAHIPLLLLADGLLREQDKGLVVDDVSSQTDVLATIADILDIPTFFQHGVGQSLMRKPSPSTPRGVVLMNQFGSQSIGLRIGDLKYVRSGRDRYDVFNLSSDPLELSPIERASGIQASLETRTQMRFASDAVDFVQQLYKANGFVPPAPQNVTDGSFSTTTSGRHNVLQLR